MKNKFRETEMFVRDCIENMDSIIRYAGKIGDHDKQWKIQWVLRNIGIQFYTGSGALQCAKFYSEIINVEEYEKLSDDLQNAWLYAREKAEEIV